MYGKLFETVIAEDLDHAALNYLSFMSEMDVISDLTEPLKKQIDKYLFPVSSTTIL